MRALTLSTLLLTITLPLFGQSGTTTELPGILLTLMGVVALLILTLVVLVGNSMLHVRAREMGVADKSNYGVFPTMAELFGRKDPAYTGGEPVTRLRRGFDIRLKGQAGTDIREGEVNTYAVQPPNFVGMPPIPRVAIEVGASIKAGEPLCYDKNRPDMPIVSPVSGELVEIRRGPKRMITHLVILADKEQKYLTLSPPDPAKASRQELVAFLQSAGFWPFLRQRPFNTIPDPGQSPRDIFISTFDSAPLAPDNNLIVETDGEAFQAGLDVLGRLTDGQVHLGLNARSAQAPSRWFAEARGVVRHWFSGPHPAGNVGVQIHHVRPLKPGEIIWTLGVQDVMTLGRLFRDRRFDASRVVALTGAELTWTGYVRTRMGASVADLIRGLPAEGEDIRFISGDVLTGAAKEPADFLDAFDDQLTAVQEGRTHELFGWLLPLRPRPSISRTFPNFLMPGMRFRAETNTHGEERAFVVTGLYEDVTPMDIYPQHLLKAVLAGDFEKMEGLGIHEVVEEDLALCEFVCPSKVPVQEILRDGMRQMQEQG